MEREIDLDENDMDREVDMNRAIDIDENEMEREIRKISGCFYYFVSYLFIYGNSQPFNFVAIFYVYKGFVEWLMKSKNTKPN